MSEYPSMRAAAQRRIKRYQKSHKEKVEEKIPKIEGQIGTGKKHSDSKGRMRKDG